MSLSKIAQIYLNDFFLELKNHSIRVNIPTIDSVDVGLSIQEVNIKYLKYLIIIVIEDADHDIPIELVTIIKSGKLNFETVTDFAPLNPCFAFDTIEILKLLNYQ